ncbi:hypothetical protein ZIOFF_019520 [Zingiber officinale]|uniref:C2H2-type domain-containing protein n=1 Tax=Zingiber officinale TaxID=94328 RepID=A0A8J5H758_ZINOF|nr:hypothetical protein ZIOFF_019520 [Zingiber officinale]
MATEDTKPHKTKKEYKSFRIHAFTFSTPPLALPLSRYSHSPVRSQPKGIHRIRGRVVVLMVVKRRPSLLFHYLFVLLLMAVTSFLTTDATTDSHLRRRDPAKNKKKKRTPPPPPSRSLPPPSSSSSSSSSWEQFKSLLSCRSAVAQVHDPASRLGRAVCGSSICAIRDVVHGNTRVVHRSDTDLSSDASSITQNETAPLARSARHRQAPPAASLGCRGGGYYSPLPKLSGCYECHAVSVDSSSRGYPRPRTMLCACAECGEVFTKPETLELHEITRHGVSELGPDDSGRNIVEIIFKSSWLKRDRPISKIERILKVRNTARTVARFEDYRAAVKSRALPHSAASGATHHNHPSRCAADGNELLRFHCTSLSCPLGARGSTSLCSNTGDTASSAVACGVCAIIRHGFARANRPHDVRTTASSGRAHDCGHASGAADDRLRAMLVCRVIAGRVRRPGDDPAAEDAYDSVAVPDGSGAYGNLEELLVANPRAILPCFVVIYRALDRDYPSTVKENSNLFSDGFWIDKSARLVVAGT